jgi:hypothetical protein
MKIMALTVALAATPAWADSHPPKEPIPETSYQSAFADYKPFQDETLYDWRQVNGEMGRLRGHMGHLETGQAAGQPTHEHGKPAERTPQASGDKP